MSVHQTAVNLPDFLLARISEDEAAAVVEQELRADDPYWTSEDAEAWERRQTPARVLAECEAKRSIVAACTQTRPAGRSDYGYSAGYLDGESEMAETTLRHLALPYADHPDYDEGWRP